MTKERTLDLSEKGLKDGEPVSLDRRLFMKFTAFTGCTDAAEAAEVLAAAGVEGALYLDANDPKGIGLIVLSEDPDYFVSTLRADSRGPTIRMSLAQRASAPIVGLSADPGSPPR